MNILIQDRIQRWGFCNSACTDDRDTFLFANVNLLTDKECEELLKNGGEYIINLDSFQIIGKSDEFMIGGQIKIKSQASWLSLSLRGVWDQNARS